MTEQKTKEELSAMSVEEVLGMTTADIKEFSFTEIPLGLYSGVVKGWVIPTQEEPFYQVEVDFTAIREISDPEKADFSIDGVSLTGKYKHGVGGAITSMRTDWGQFFDAVGGGNLGTAMAQGAGAQINFEVDHFIIYKDKDTGIVFPKPKVFAQIKNVEMA